MFPAAVIPKLKELHDRFLNAYNVHLTVTPTTHLPAGPIDQVQPWVMYNGKLVDTFDAYGQTVFLGPPLGIPAISIPIGLSTDGLPLGIHFQARPGEWRSKTEVLPGCNKLVFKLVQLISRMHWGAQPDSMPARECSFGLLLNVLTLAAANADLAELVF